jgi:hypothetical protein
MRRVAKSHAPCPIKWYKNMRFLVLWYDTAKEFMLYMLILITPKKQTNAKISQKHLNVGTNAVAGYNY